MIIQQNHTQCVVPWLSLEIKTQGQVSPCCVGSRNLKSENGSEINYYSDEFTDIYQHQFLKDLREDLGIGIHNYESILNRSFPIPKQPAIQQNLQADRGSKSWGQFMTAVKAHDKYRNQNFSKVFSEYFELCQKNELL